MAGEQPVRFEFATATRIIFGPGTLTEIGPLAAAAAKRVLVVIGKSASRAEPLLRRLHGHSLEWEIFSVGGEPTLHLVRAGVCLGREKGCELVIGFGGGSAIDAGKAIAALLTNGGDIFQYLEVIGGGQPLTQPSAAFFAIPTTAGTGAEVTRNAVLGSPEHEVKVSLRSPFMLPRLALVDPELTYDLPPPVTASTGLDALTQLIEAFVSNRANPLTDSLCREGISRVARSLRAAYSGSTWARSDMALASLLSGLALANAGLGAVHGFAAPIGGMFSAPHGAICAALLPHVVRKNVQALQARAPDSPALERYREVGRMLLGANDLSAAELADGLQCLCKDLAVGGLHGFGVTEAAIPTIGEKALHASSMKGNPIQLTSEQVHEILVRAL